LIGELPAPADPAGGESCVGARRRGQSAEQQAIARAERRDIESFRAYLVKPIRAGGRVAPRRDPFPESVLTRAEEVLGSSRIEFEFSSAACEAQHVNPLMNPELL
jgi:hypothetical protein